MGTNEINIRIDKWLWAARFFKTRSLAAKAVSGGKVHLNGHRIKPAREVGTGDQLVIHKAELEFTVTICGVNQYRRPASEARLLYEETEESIKKREEFQSLRKMSNAGHSVPAKRPSKRDRRKIKEFIRKQ